MRQRRRRSVRPSALLAAACAAAVLAAAAEGAVRQSVYTVTEIRQTSSVRAGFGTFAWDNRATLLYRAAPGRNQVRFDFPTRSSFDPFTKGGRNPRYGVLQVDAKRITQSGGVTQDGLRCLFAPVVPAGEREMRVRFYRTSTRARTVLVEVSDQHATLRTREEGDSGRLRAAGCDRMPSIGTAPRSRPRGDDYAVSFAVPRAKFRKAKARRPTTLVLRGTARTPVTSNPGTIGTLTVRTTVKLRLLRSR